MIISVASLDKASVREEIDCLKADFDGLSAEGKVSAEIQAIMNSLFMIIELVPAVFLERTTKKNNKNFSIPSSQTEKDESALGRSGSKGDSGSPRVVGSTNFSKTDITPELRRETLRCLCNPCNAAMT